MGPDGKYVMVMVTVPGDGLGGRIAVQLVEDGLAACVGRTKVNSTYMWEGKIENDDEELLLIKTTRAAFDRLREKVMEMHTYDVPEIIALPIEAGLPSYLNWISESVMEGGAGDDP